MGGQPLPTAKGLLLSSNGVESSGQTGVLAFGHTSPFVGAVVIGLLRCRRSCSRRSWSGRRDAASIGGVPRGSPRRSSCAPRKASAPVVGLVAFLASGGRTGGSRGHWGRVVVARSCVV